MGQASLIAGKYEVLDEIGRSAAGTTYRVRHAILDSLLTVTVLPAELTEDPHRLSLVEGAVRQASRLRHDHIVPVLDFGREADRYHVVEGLLDGDRLDRVLREGGSLAPAEALAVARDLADALAYAHERGVVHGALGPDRVWLRPGVPRRAMLCGFATAAALSTPSPALLAYAAPERLAGTDPDPGSDIFALGLLIFEMCEGKPFFAGGEDEIRDVLLHGTARLLPRFSRIVPRGISLLVARAIRRSAAERTQSMVQLRREIEACLQRLGRGSAQARIAAPGDAPVRRHAGIVIDEASEERAEAPARVKLAAREPSVLGRVLVAPTGLPDASRRRSALAGGMLVAAVVLLLVRPLFRAPTTPPAPPAPASAPSEARIDPGRAVPTSELPDRTVAPAAPGPGAGTPVVEAEPPAGNALGPAPEPVTRPATRRNLPPRIVSSVPHQGDPISMTEGSALEFSVLATDRDPDDQLRYAWLLDGRTVGQRQSWRFVAPPAAAATTHTVEVQVSDRAGSKAPPVSWKLEVTPRMSEANVRDWLGRLASAWERRDIATLQLYGIVKTEKDAEAVHERLLRNKAYSVSIANETIQTEGKYATVSFDRTEYDARGTLLSSQRESYALEKHPSGFVALRAR